MIYFKLNDQFGNWLFRYASALGIGQPVAALVSDKTAPAKMKAWPGFFDGLQLVDRLPEGTRTYCEPRFAYTPFPTELQSGDWLIDGYFQSERYFNMDDIRRRFMPSSETLDPIREKYADWLSRPGVTGVSVRRGDYLRYPEYHPFVGERFYQDAFARLPEVRDFIVCGNDLDWCRWFFRKTFPDRNFLIAEGDAPHDLMLLSLCKNNVIANSTFSWWSAWLNQNPGRRVLAPSNWFGYGYRRFDVSDIYMKGTEIIRNRQQPGQFLRGLCNLVSRKFHGTGKGISR